MYRFATTLMILVMTFGSQLANATPPEDMPSVIVQFADLDLTHIEGVAVLYGRLKGAAETVCAAWYDRAPERQRRYKACWQAALRAAMAKLDNPALTAYYRAQLGGRTATIQIAQH